MRIEFPDVFEWLAVAGIVVAVVVAEVQVLVQPRIEETQRDPGYFVYVPIACLWPWLRVLP
jgi:hypothetical protein